MQSTALNYFRDTRVIVDLQIPHSGLEYTTLVVGNLPANQAKNCFLNWCRV